MRIATLILLGLLTASVSIGIAREVDSDIRDTAARIDYGWFTAELGLIIAARDALQTGSGDPWKSYLHAYASYRAAQLMQAQGVAIGPILDDCQGSADAAASDKDVEVEANVLQAACAALAAADEPLRSVFHQRRLRQALQHAHSLEADNPRLLLVTYLYARDTREGSQSALEAILAAYRDPADRHAYPDWGQAEAVTELGALRLESNDLRGARDLLEEALILAPDYSAAVQLRRRIQSPIATD